MHSKDFTSYYLIIDLQKISRSMLLLSKNSAVTMIVKIQIKARKLKFFSHFDGQIEKKNFYCDRTKKSCGRTKFACGSTFLLNIHRAKIYA